MLAKNQINRNKTDNRAKINNKTLIFKVFYFKKINKNKLLGIKFPANFPAEE